MRRWTLLSLMLFVASVVLLGASVATGDGQIGLFLIFPFIVAWGPLAVAGAVMLLLAVLSAFVGIWNAGEAVQMEGGGSGETGTYGAPKPERKFGGVVLIGPIPIAFGSDRDVANKMLLLGIALFMVLLIIFLVLVHPFF